MAGVAGSGASTVTSASSAWMADSSVVKLSIAQLFLVPTARMTKLELPREAARRPVRAACLPGFVRTVTDTISPNGSNSERRLSLASLPPSATRWSGISPIQSAPSAAVQDHTRSLVNGLWSLTRLLVNAEYRRVWPRQL